MAKKTMMDKVIFASFNRKTDVFHAENSADRIVRCTMFSIADLIGLEGRTVDPKGMETMRITRIVLASRRAAPASDNIAMVHRGSNRNSLLEDSISSY